MLNVTFDIGRQSNNIHNVVVKNIPNTMYKWTPTYNDKGRCIMVAEIDMPQLHTLWEKRGKPCVLDCYHAEGDVQGTNASVDDKPFP